MDDPWVKMVITVVCSVVASSGFWTFLQNRKGKNDSKTELLIGLAHDRIIYLGNSYIERGYITTEEYENLHDYLYVPYSKNGGNGSAERVVIEVKKLPIKKASSHDKEE